MKRSLAIGAILVSLVACTGAPAVSPAGTPSVTLDLSAQNSIFDKDALSVAAGAPYAIRLDNKDAVPHNVAVVGGPPGSVAEIFTGPAVRTHTFPALTAGSYTFRCDVHPEMTGTITAD